MIPKLSLSDRVVCGATGAVLGGVVGFGLSGLFGVYSNTLGAGRAPIDIRQWVIVSATFFGVVGVLFGPVVGTVVGAVIAAIYKVESFDPPAWVVVFLLAGIVGGVLWWLTK